MACRRWRWPWSARVLCGLVLIPPLMWLLVLLIVPTGWARRRIVAQLEARSGRRVELDAISLGLAGGVRLNGLRIGSPGDARDPWLTAAEVRLDFGLMRLLGASCRPARLEADGVALRVLRRGDGTLELADLVKPVPVPRADEVGPSAAEPRITVRLRRGTVTVVDEPTATRIQLADIEGEGYAEGPLAVVEQLQGTVNGGTVRFTARLDRTRAALAAEARLQADDVGLDGGMSVLRYVVPVLASASTAVKGRLNAELTLQGRGPTWPDLAQSLAGQGSVALDRLALDGGPLIAEVAQLADFGGRQRIGSLRTDFVYQARRIMTDQFTLHVGRVPVTMSGWTDLDGRVDYRLNVEALRDRLPDRARRILGELKLDAGSPTSLTLRGTLDRLVVEVGGVPIDGKKLRASRPRLSPDDREQLRLLSRRIRDQLLR